MSNEIPTPKTDAERSRISTKLSEGGPMTLGEIIEEVLAFACTLELAAKAPVCVGPRTIGILAETGQWLSEDGLRGLIAADELFHQDPYKELDALRVQLAQALDAASKGDESRLTASGMEMEIADLRAQLESVTIDRDERAKQKSEFFTEIESFRAQLTAAQEERDKANKSLEDLCEFQRSEHRRLVPEISLSTHPIHSVIVAYQAMKTARDLAISLLTSTQAACVAKDEALRLCEPDPYIRERVVFALSSDAGQPLLDEVKRLRETLEKINAAAADAVTWCDDDEPYRQKFKAALAESFAALNPPTP